MTMSRTIERRLRSHRLTAPAGSIAEAASHMLATQAQEFWGGRWALAARTRGEPTLSSVDAAFDRGDIVRSWTMRGTIHIVPAADLAWLIGITGERQRRQGAAVHRREGIDDAEVARAERLLRGALRGGGRLTRAELFAVLDAGGVPTAGQRGYHLLTQLSTRGVLVQGPVVPREGGPTREQFFVLAEEWIRHHTSSGDPLAEYFTRFIDGHGPAGASDFARWSGLPLGAAREAAAAAAPGLVQVGDEPEPWYTARTAPRRSSRAPDVVALPPFEEYYIPYVDRAAVVDPAALPAIGPGLNGMVRPILVAGGRVFGAWTHSLAVGRRSSAPEPTVFDDTAASDDEIRAALDRYARFISG